MIRPFSSLLVLLALAACTPENMSEVATGDVTPQPPVNVAPVIDVTGEACGGITGVLCPVGFFCEKPEGQCLDTLDGVGSCQPTPESCPDNPAPVCGCDGVTYDSPCDAAQAGASIVAQGECGSADTL